MMTPSFVIPPPQYRRVRGLLIEELQMALTVAGYAPGPPDGVFGSVTQGALAGWQAANGITPALGQVDSATWIGLTGKAFPTIEERALQLTADFEGHGFTLLQGNYDGAGLTWGIIGYTLKHGEITRIIREVDPAIVYRAFGSLAPELYGAIDKSTQARLEWADSISIGRSRAGVLPEWKDAFERFGNEPEVRRIQLEHVAPYQKIARRDMGRFGLTSDPAFALCFDVAVQNGGVDSSEGTWIHSRIRQTGATTERQKMDIIAQVIAQTSNPRWRKGVWSRKSTIAQGEGTVNGSKYLMSAWGVI